MDAQQLLDELTCPDELPLKAIQWAEAHRDELVPVFLRFLRSYLDEPGDPEVPTPLLFAMHFLGSWRIQEAYRPIAEVMRSNPERLELQLGDTITETVPRLLRNLFDGDPQPLLAVIECDTADEFARASVLELLASLAHEGELRRDELTSWLRATFATLRPREPNAVWIGWVSVVASLGLVELAALADQAFDGGFVDPTVFPKDDFHRELQEPRGKDDGSADWRGHIYKPFGSVAKELASWDFGGISDEELARLEAGLPLSEDDDHWLDDASEEDRGAAPSAPVEPVINPHRGVGRNDPCPCGSGKKYKKCCLPLHGKGT
jgi:hypothetical protein